MSDLSACSVFLYFLFLPPSFQRSNLSLFPSVEKLFRIIIFSKLGKRFLRERSIYLIYKDVVPSIEDDLTSIEGKSSSIEGTIRGLIFTLIKRIAIFR